MKKKDFPSNEIEDSRDLVRILLHVEDEFGIVPDMCDGGLWIDPTAANAHEMDDAIKEWGSVRHRLIAGEISQEEYDAWKRGF